MGFGSSASTFASVGPIRSSQKGRNYNVPTIPSRFLTPVLNFDSIDKYPDLQEGSTGMETILVSKVERLTHDGRNIGPGQYDVINSKRSNEKSPRGTINWGNSKE